MSDINAILCEQRVLFVPPTRRDGEVTQSLLTDAHLATTVCRNLGELAREIERGAAAVLLTGELLGGSEFAALQNVLSRQPAWSDLPIVVLMKEGLVSPAASLVLASLGNVMLLERPAPARSVVSAVRTAVRSRQRQYQIRDQFETIRRAEAVSHELRRQLEIAVDSSELGTFHCEMPSDRIDWNERCKAHFWLPPDAEVDFDLFYSIIHPDDRERTRRAVEACVYGGENYDVEYRTVSPQGDVRWVRATGRTSFDAEGKPTRFDGTTKDVTDRKRAEEALLEADRRKDEFLATLAHELRNPLGPIRNSLHLFQLSGELGPAMEPVRAIMERQVNHMVRLIDDLLDVSRISRGKIELRKDTLELAAVVATAVETARPTIEAAEHQLAIALPAEPIVLEADAVRLAQVIGNLLNNAAKYTPRGGQIWLNVATEADEATICVRDTGLGIPPEMLDRVFDMFAQVDQTLTRAQGGLGIGLTLAKSIVEMHGGRIEARSAGPNQGSEFTVLLPLKRGARLHAPSGRRTPAIDATTCRLPPRRILVVDDTHASGFVLSRLLEQMGQQVRTVHDAASALESVRSERPDLVISDIAMPRMDGYELARRLREEPGLKDLTLVALTGYGQESDRERAKAAGFDHHLVKPVALDALQELLRIAPNAQSNANKS